MVILQPALEAWKFSMIFIDFQCFFVIPTDLAMFLERKLGSLWRPVAWEYCPHRKNRSWRLPKLDDWILEVSKTR